MRSRRALPIRHACAGWVPLAGVLLVQLLGCAATAPPDGASSYQRAELERREAQVARGLAGTRDAQAERNLHALTCRLAPARCPSLRVYVVADGPPQARAWPNGMLLVHGALFELLDDEAELAFVLAHEVAHLELGHHRAGGTPDSGVAPGGDANRGAALEIAADAWARARLRALGYREDAGAGLLARLGALREARPPGLDARLEALR